MKRPLRIGLTGGIGSGKSMVAKVFEVLAVPVFYADAAAKEVMNTDVTLRQQLTDTFGEQTYENGVLNRAYLSSVVFTDPYQLERLNAMAHPATIAAAERWFAQQTTSYVVKEAALLFESGSAAGLDYIIGVTAPQSLRILRTMTRDNITQEQVLQRMDKQMEDAVKMKLCNFVLVNDEQQLLLPQIMKLHEELLSLSNDYLTTTI